MDKNNTQYKPLLFINIMIHIREITEKIYDNTCYY